MALITQRPQRKKENAEVFIIFASVVRLGDHSVNDLLGEAHNLEAGILVDNYIINVKILRKTG